MSLEKSPLNGQHASKSGPKICPENVPAVLEMPWPADVKSLFWLLRTVQYRARLSGDCISTLSTVPEKCQVAFVGMLGEIKD